MNILDQFCIDTVFEVAVMCLGCRSVVKFEKRRFLVMLTELFSSNCIMFLTSCSAFSEME